MSIRSDALRWLESSYGPVNGPIHTSKFYQPHEPWTKRETWWLQFPVTALKQNNFIHFVCQKEPNKNRFHYFKVPSVFLLNNLKGLCVLDDNKLSIFLSAEDQNLFADERGKGKVSFKEYLLEVD